MARFQVIGVNDDKDFCECCGRSGLKRVVWIQDEESGEIKHFGTTCATSPKHGFGVDTEVKVAVKRADDKIRTLNILASYAYRRKGGSYIKNADGVSWTPADRDLLQACKAEIEARGFNY